MLNYPARYALNSLEFKKEILKLLFYSLKSGFGTSNGQTHNVGNILKRIEYQIRKPLCFNLHAPPVSVSNPCANENPAFLHASMDLLFL